MTRIPTSRTLPRTLAVLATLYTSLWCATAAASPSYPEIISDELGMGCIPQCTICHLDNSGGFGTARKPFGEAMQGVGLESGQENDLPGFLRQLETDGTDSDGDGTGDIAELSADTDPNVSGDQTVCEGGPQYGCGARIAPAPSARDASLAALAVLALLVGRRRRWR